MREYNVLYCLKACAITVLAVLLTLFYLLYYVVYTTFNECADNDNCNFDDKDYEWDCDYNCAYDE